ncbi:LacI family transcriptional regulator [Gleimia sp. 6138-11-ORH1]|uniref:LacI family DNA-binding transcriptional regulator n=1 Tax=Gleimia sp. 6138-11-ORH1 TaxID=2973937 RepID=UPI002168A94F|nr:LacI family DNA-binding transcriptional regulator [Gleimia sp. 6138-11-ORH1]MCS4485004.1 LacI family transcriptional regulator [Gleimia sp. 6138-11-ORH1]
MTNRISLAKLAKQAGVSTATVSRVLNGKDVVAPETRQAVLTAIDLLGYERPEKLRRRPTRLIGLIIPELSNPVFPLFAQYLENALTSHGYTPILCTQRAGGVTEDTHVQLLLDHGINGLIFVSGLHADLEANPQRYQKLIEQKVPFVTVNGSNPVIKAPDFSLDDALTMRQAIRHLRSLGHSQIGLAVGPSRFVPVSRKTASFKAEMQRLFPTQPVHVTNTLFTLEGGQAATQKLLDYGCTAIIYGSDIMALGGIQYCQANGVSVPDDLSIIGFDDTPLIRFTSPSLTTFRHPLQEMSQMAVSTLNDMINGVDLEPHSMTFQSELFVRESTSTLA